MAAETERERRNRTSQQAVLLRATATAWAKHKVRDGGDPNDRSGARLDRALRAAAVAYTDACDGELAEREYQARRKEARRGR